VFVYEEAGRKEEREQGERGKDRESERKRERWVTVFFQAPMCRNENHDWSCSSIQLGKSTLKP
jgi:hypothetical protein